MQEELMEELNILSDSKRNIAFSSILSLYSINFNSTPPPTADCTILDFQEEPRIITEAGNIRDKKPEMPLLIVVDYPQVYYLYFLDNIPGTGPIRFLYWRKEYEEQLLEYTQSLVHLEYPSAKSDIAIVLPVYNEESRFEHISNFIKKLTYFIETSFINATIYFVNDGSIDKTSALVKKIISEQKEEMEIVQKFPFFTEYNLLKNTRKAGTYIKGIQTINADIIVFVDADDSFFLDDIARMINILRVGYYDMVVGTKDLTAEHRPLVRRMMSFFKRLLTRKLLPRGIYDSQTGLKVMTSTAARYILGHLHTESELAADLEILYLAKLLKFRVLQLPVKCIDREGSHINIIKDSIHFLKAIVNIPRLNRDLRKKIKN